MTPILQEGSELKNAFFVFKFIPNSLSTHRFAIVLSSKLLKKATDRNRKRRQIYATLEEILKENAVQESGGSDIVILVRQATLRLPYQELKKELLSLLHHSHIQK